MSYLVSCVLSFIWDVISIFLLIADAEGDRCLLFYILYCASVASPSIDGAVYKVLERCFLEKQEVGIRTVI